MCVRAHREGRGPRCSRVRSLSLLPDGYHIERDPEVLTLLRADGTVVGRFSARGVEWREVTLLAAADAGIVHPSSKGMTETSAHFPLTANR